MKQEGIQVSGPELYFLSPQIYRSLRFEFGEDDATGVTYPNHHHQGAPPYKGMGQAANGGGGWGDTMDLSRRSAVGLRPLPCCPRPLRGYPLRHFEEPWRSGPDDIVT